MNEKRRTYLGRAGVALVLLLGVILSIALIYSRPAGQNCGPAA